MKNESLKDELKRLAPQLKELREQKEGFRLPDHYLESFEDRMMQRIESSDIRRQASIAVKPPAKRFVMYRLVAAAAVLALLAAAIWFFLPAQPGAPQVASVQLTEDDIESYVLDNVQDFELEQLAMIPNDEMAPESSEVHPGASPKSSGDSLHDVTPDDVKHILNDMTEEELEEIL